MEEMIHVTANEAGRNSVFKDRYLLAIDTLIDGIINEHISKEEIIKCLFLLKKFAIKNIKTQPTLRRK